MKVHTCFSAIFNTALSTGHTNECDHTCICVHVSSFLLCDQSGSIFIIIVSWPIDRNAQIKDLFLQVKN
jgi:hypothetical protein